MNYLKKALLLFLFIFVKNTQPFVSCYIFKKNDNSILIFGDIHHVSISDRNLVHANEFINFINNFQFQVPIPFLLETGVNLNNIKLTPSMTENINANCAKDITVKTLYSYYSQNQERLNLVSYDCRDSKAYILYLILENLDNFLYNKNASDAFDFEAFKTTIKYSCDILLKDYIDYLQKNIEFAQSCLQKLDEKSLEFKELSYLSEKHTQRIDYILGLLLGTDTNVRFDMFLINSFEKCKTIQEATDQRQQLLFSLFYADARFADIGFLQQLIAIQSKNYKTIFMTGNFHAINISASLQRIGYKLIIFAPLNPKKGPSMFSVEKAIQSFLTAEL